MFRFVAKYLKDGQPANRAYKEAKDDLTEMFTIPAGGSLEDFPSLLALIPKQITIVALLSVTK